MKIDLNEIKNNVVPRLNNSANYLEQAINSIAGYSIPEYFEYKEYMQKLPNNIRSIKNEVNVVKSWAENIANRFQQAERNNSSLINEINSNLNIGNTSASIYSTGAVIGKNTASSNPKGNNILEVIGNNIKKGINKVGTIISSIWNSIFNNISQTTVDLFEACKAKVVANFESLLNMLNFKGENKSDSVTTSKSSNKLIDEPEVQEGLGQLNNLLEIQNNELNVNAENMKNSISSKTYNPYLANLLSKYCNSMDFTDLNDVSFMMNTLRNITEQLDLYIIDGEIPEPEIITETNGTKKVQFAGLIFTYEEWKAIQHYMKSRDLTWYDLKEEFRQSQDLLQTYYQDLLGRKNSIYSLERYIDMYPYTYITTKVDFNSYLERDYKDINPEGEFNILTQEEKAIYFYLKEKYSEEEAKEYYNSLKDLINQRKGEIKALEYVSTLDLTGLDNIDGINNFLMTTGVGFEDGVWQFGENIVNLIPGQGEIRSELQYKQMYIMQMLTQEINLDEIAQKYGKESGEYKLYEKISKMQSVYKEALGINYNVASSIGNQAIPIAVSFIPEVGTELGVALSALSAAGGAKAQAYQNGVTGWDAYLYAGIQGISSAVVTRYFAAIPGLSSNASTTIKGILKGATQARTFSCCTSKGRRIYSKITIKATK